MHMSRLEALTEIFHIENIHSKIPSITSKISAEDLLRVLSLQSYVLSDMLGIPPRAAVKIVHSLWPDKPRSNGKVCTWLLAKYSLRHCRNCDQVKDLEDFSKNSSRPSGYNSHCKLCYLENTRDYQREYQKRVKLLKMDRIPSWANLDKIKEIYRTCPEGYHVDHIVPLQGKLVSGLHVEYNLQHLPASENLAKGNKFKP